MGKRLVAIFVLLIAGAGVRADESAPVPLFEGLGKHSRAVETTSAEAQRYFDQGLAFVFAFNHDEAIRSFQKAADLDPECAMAWWGVALANGPHINKPVVTPDRAKAAWIALGRARAATRARATDRALIEALGARYADPQPKDRKGLDLAYANAMRTVWQANREDADVGAMFAEALMDLRPWDLWTAEGRPQPGTAEALMALAAVLTMNKNHPLALHLAIHAIEASPHPENAQAAADTLRDLAPGLGHLLHMPSHIDVRRGHWEEAIIANTKAMDADRKYREMVPRQGFYKIYMSHNHHMLAYAAMMSGRSAEALKAIDAMVEMIPTGLDNELIPFVDGYMAMPLEVRMRFGRWQEILDAPEPPVHFPVANTMRHYARGVAYAAQGKTKEARQEQKLFETRRTRVAKDAIFGNNSAADLLAVAKAHLAGEILYRERKEKEAFAALRQAVAAEDKLRYDEPPDWVHPTRHALGAALLRSQQYSEAEKVFREDLARLPDNGWGLFGLERSLRAQNKAEAEKVKARFGEIWAKADVTLSSPCFCQAAE